MTNNIDINEVLLKTDNITKNKYIVINNLIKKVSMYDDLNEEKKRLNDTLKSLNINKKILFTLELFIASNFTLSSRAMEKLLKEEHEKNEEVPLLSKSAIDRYLRNEEVIKNNYSSELYNKILESRIEITEKNRISKK